MAVEGSNVSLPAVPQTPVTVKAPNAESPVIGERPLESITGAEPPTRVSFNAINTLQELGALLNVNLLGGRPLSPGTSPDIRSLDDIQLELPREVTKCDPVLFFEQDKDLDWIVIQERISHAKTPFSNYKEWLVRWRHSFEEMSKNGYVVYKISQRETAFNRTVIPFTYSGFDATFDQLCSDKVSTLKEYLIQSSIPTNVSYKSSRINVCLPKVVANVYSRMQMYILAPRPDLDAWVKRFYQTKYLRQQLGYKVPLGDSEEVFIPSAHPRHLPEYIAALPMINKISVAYSTAFVSPDVTFLPVSVGTVSNDVGVMPNQPEQTLAFLTYPIVEANRQDFNKLIMSWMLPSQVILDVTLDDSLSIAMKFVGALCAKVLLSYSSTCRNLTRRSADDLDDAILNFLRWIGINSSSTGKFKVTSPTLDPVARAWQAVLTGEDGAGWLNEACVPRRQIADPLYSGIGCLPLYGGLDVLYSSNDLARGVTPPPIYSSIVEALEMTTRVKLRSSQRSKQVENVLEIFTEFQPSYIKSMSMLNEHILRTGETGFRLGITKLRELEMLELQPGASGAKYDSPICPTVSVISLMLMFRQMPATFTPSPRILRQPVMESGICAELQRLFSICVLTLRQIAQDGKTDVVKSDAVLELVLENSISNHFAKSILSIVRMGKGSSLLSFDNMAAFMNRFDDFEAAFYHDCSEVILTYPELFGMTRDVVVAFKRTQIVNERQYIEKSAGGIVDQNDIQDKRNVRRMSPDDYQVHLDRGDVLATLMESDGTISLPIWYEYRESMGTTWPSETPVIQAEVPSPDAPLTETESIKTSTFERFFLLAKKRPRFCADALLINNCFRQNWYSGFASYTNPFSARIIENSFSHAVTNWKDFVTFRNVFVLASGSGKAVEKTGTSSSAD